MPSSTQGYNRYAYVQNNPLKYTDPSGYFLDSILNSVGRFLQTYAVQIVTIVIAVYAPWTAVGNGFAAGFVGGYLGSGGDLKAAFMGGVYGALSAGVADGVAGLNYDNFGASVMHGFSQGVVSELRGGQFKEGILSGFAGHYLPTNFKEGLKNASIEMRTAFAAMSGGIAAKLGGGKFENGAVTAAFVHLFNAELSKDTHNVSDGGDPKKDPNVSHAVRNMKKDMYNYCDQDCNPLFSTDPQFLGPLTQDQVNHIIISRENNGHTVNGLSALSRVLPHIKIPVRGLVIMDKIAGYTNIKPMVGDIIIYGVATPNKPATFPNAFTTIIRRN